MRQFGPVEYMVVSFPGNKFKGEIIPALGELVDTGVMRILDLAFVSKDPEGNIRAFEVEDMGSETGAAFQRIQAEVGDLVNMADLQAIGEGLDANSSAAVLVWEDVWATKFTTALRDADAVLVDLQRIPRDVFERAAAHSTLK